MEVESVSWSENVMNREAKSKSRSGNRSGECVMEWE